MPSADQIREWLEVRADQLESELRQLRAVHAAVTASDRVVDGLNDTPKDDHRQMSENVDPTASRDVSGDG
jgi:hypothetical protein